MQQQPNIEHIFVCVGGGGLISGLAIGAKSVKPDVNIIGILRRFIKYDSELIVIQVACLRMAR